MLPFQSIVGLQWPIWKCARLNQETACTCRHAIKSLLWNYTVWEKTPSLREKIPFYRAIGTWFGSLTFMCILHNAFNRLRIFQPKFHNSCIPFSRFSILGNISFSEGISCYYQCSAGAPNFVSDYEPQTVACFQTCTAFQVSQHREAERFRRHPSIQKNFWRSIPSDVILLNEYERAYCSSTHLLRNPYKPTKKLPFTAID